MCVRYRGMGWDGKNEQPSANNSFIHPFGTKTFIRVNEFENMTNEMNYLPIQPSLLMGDHWCEYNKINVLLLVGYPKYGQFHHLAFYASEYQWGTAYCEEFDVM